MRIVLAFALFFGGASASLPTIAELLANCRLSTTLEATETQVDGICEGLQNLQLGGNFETDIDGELTFGANYDYNEGEQTFHPPHEVYARWTGTVGGGELNALGLLNLNTNGRKAEISYVNGDTNLLAKLDLAKMRVLDYFSLSHKRSVAGHGLTVTPTVDAEGCAVTLLTRFDVNDDTHLELTSDVSAPRSSVLRVSHRIDENNLITPEINLESRHMKCGYERSLGDTTSVKTHINVKENIELEWTDSSAWTTKVNVPWGNAKDLDVSFKREFIIKD